MSNPTTKFKADKGDPNFDLALRPKQWDEFIGQEHLTGKERVLRRSIEADKISSMIFWGPPGSGKTTLAEIIARLTSSHFISMSAVTAGVSDIRQAAEKSRQNRKERGERTILFIDEIHRFNKAQQDATLPFVEKGLFCLIGATTENPSFSVNSALLSRSRVFKLEALRDHEVEAIVQRALVDEESGLGKFGVELSSEALNHLVTMANGDARVALNALELATAATEPDEKGKRQIPLEVIEEALQQRALLYDKAGDQHYDLISALHKAVRGSDPDGALYWLARMLEAGEDPLYIVRRMIRMASEDIGMADHQALVIAMAAQQAVHFVGMPEANLALAELAVYLAVAPKSNALYTAYSKILEDIEKTRNDPVPLHLRNPVTSLMKGFGYGKGYKYAHDDYRQLPTPYKNLPPPMQLQDYLPENLVGRRYYEPTNQGREARIREWLEERRGRSRTPPTRKSP